jgi:GNAT superfamily N-acetyltransferase
MYRWIASMLSRRAGVRLFRFYSRRLGPAEATLPPQGVELRTLSAGDARALCESPALDLAPDNVSAAYARGDVCVGALIAGRLAGYCWLAFGPLHHLDGVWVQFDARTAWIYKSLVLPEHRGRGIAAALYRFAGPLSIERRRESAIICMEDHNQSSIAAARRAGYTAAGRAGYWLRGTQLRVWRSPAVKRAAVRFYLPAAK